MVLQCTASYFKRFTPRPKPTLYPQPRDRTPRYLSLRHLSPDILPPITQMCSFNLSNPQRYEELDEEIVDIDSTGALVINQGSVDPPFESKIAEINPKMVNIIKNFLNSKNEVYFPCKFLCI